MEAIVQRQSLSFSIDSILSKESKCQESTIKYSPYADDTSDYNTQPCFGTEALDARLAQSSCSDESADEDEVGGRNLTTSPSINANDSIRPASYTDEKQPHLILKCKSKKKTRTVFSRQQVFYLEAAFDAKRYLSSAERSEIATSLNLSETQVKVWFQNRRNKWKAQLNGDDKGSATQDHSPIFLPPFLCNSVAAAVSAHAQIRQSGGMAPLPFFRQPIMY